MIELEWTPPEEFDEYRLIRLIGRGAMGEVYLARDTLLDRAVAVKFVAAARDPSARARLFAEARAIARLQHPNVVAIYRIGEIAGHPYLVSEYVRGRSLDQLSRPVSSHEAREIAIDLARGLAAAHRSGILHRDVKPANAIVTDDGTAKLLDFGLAAIADAPAVVAPIAAPPAERFAIDPRSPLTAVDTMPLIADSASRGDVPVPSRPAEPADSPHRASRRADRNERSAARPAPIVGTPLYLAPELWRGEPATQQSDLYALGILLYELIAGAAPHRGVAVALLRGVVGRTDIARLCDVAPAAEPALAAVIDRLVERDAGARFGSAEALIDALSACASLSAAVPDGNPYRGLAAFEAAHAPLFFGRRSEIRDLVQRVRGEPFMVIGGDSGTGKSSLCRAGVLPWLVDHDGWIRIDVVPGRHPVRALAAALVAALGGDETQLIAQLRDGVDSAVRAVRRLAAADPRDRSTRRLIVFVDQFEELLTVAEPEDARAFTELVAGLAGRVPALRVLATARSDFLSRLARLPGLGDVMARGLYFLRPLAAERIREAIVRPAAARGVVFESEELVDTLVAETELAPGGLPLMQFVLAELWDTRDGDERAGRRNQRTIRTAALAALGGVEGALARHADRVIAALDDNERSAVRRILLRLVTAEGTRGRRSYAELVADDHAPGTAGTAVAAVAALEALVRGRIVVANDTGSSAAGTYELAHEALLVSWSTLHGWRQRGAADHAVRRRIERAAASWEHMGKRRDLLWNQRQLAEASALDRGSLAPRDAAFLARSRAAIIWARIVSVAASASIAIAGLGIGLATRDRARGELAAAITGRVDAANIAIEQARTLARERDAAAAGAFIAFDRGRWDAGETAWARSERLAAREASHYRAASSHLETALGIAPITPVNAVLPSFDLRGQFADLTYERLLRAETTYRSELAEELAVRITAYDDGRYRAALTAGARVELAVTPAGTRIWSEHSGSARVLLGTAPLTPLTLSAGSRVLVFESPGRLTTRLPLLLSRGETRQVRVTLPDATTAPPGMIYVPPGRFLFGSADSLELRRGFLHAPPMHEVETAGYYIGRYEVTFGEWIAFLDQLPQAERRRRTPRAADVSQAIALVDLGNRRWRLVLTPSARSYVAETGQLLHYEHRKQRVKQDWTKFPVSAVSFEDAVAFVGWLDHTGRIAGARLCNEYEWERAARGADGRTFPSGARLAPDDANIDRTYGRDPLAFGPDEVGAHPASRSPVGADDMAGNVWEWTRSVEIAGGAVARGGGWYYAEPNARSVNRESAAPALRHVHIGIRICATPR